MLLNFTSGQPGWRGLDCVVNVKDPEAGLLSEPSFAQILKWAESGVVGGIIHGGIEGSKDCFWEDGGASKGLTEALKP